MLKEDLSGLTYAELLAEAKKLKSFSITNAFLIGFLVGIVVFSVFKNSWGMLTFIPLYLVYKLVNDPRNKRRKDIEQLLKERTSK